MNINYSYLLTSVGLFWLRLPSHVKKHTSFRTASATQQHLNSEPYNFRTQYNCGGKWMYRTEKVIWMFTCSDLVFPLQPKARHGFFWKAKSSHYYSFENPWSFALNFNQEKPSLINNSVCWLDEGLGQYWFWQVVLAAFAWRNMLVTVLKSYVSMCLFSLELCCEGGRK